MTIMDGNGYPVPDPVDPGELSCFIVYVPKDTQYIAAFWTAYEFFTFWLAWARDPLRKGKQAAAVWRRAYDKARARFELTKGECFDMITGVRANPLDPCVLQVQEDGGAWVDVFDAGCCGGGGGGGACQPAERINNGVIERWNNDAGAWEPAGPQTPPQEQTPPIAIVPSGDGACIAATNFAHKIQASKNKLSDSVGDALSFGELVLEGWDFLVAWYGLGAIWQVVSGALTALLPGLVESYADVGLFDLQSAIICMAVSHYQNDGTMTSAGVAGLIADIDAAAVGHESFNDAEGICWRYAHSWVEAAGPQGMAAAGQSMGITDGECGDCAWRIEFDFSLSAQGFTRMPVTDGHTYADNAYFGKWVSGQGWKSEIRTDAASSQQQRMAIHLVGETFRLTKAEIHYNGSHGGAPSGAFIVALVGGGYGSGTFVEANPFIDGGNQIATSGVLDSDMSDIGITAYIDSSGNTPPDAYMTVQKLVLEGRGPKPGIVPIP